MHKLKIRKVGKSIGLTLPREVAHALNVREGDPVFLTATPGGFRLTPYDPDFEEAMAAAEEVMARYRNVLRELSK